MKKRLTLKLLLVTFLSIISTQSIFADSTTYDVSVYDVFTKTKVLADTPTDLYVWVYNNDTRDLEYFDLKLFVDGVEVINYEWEGQINMWGAVEINLGSYLFSEKTPLAPYEIYATISNPNGGIVGGMYSRSMTDIISINPPLSGGTYIIGQTTDDFENFYEVSVYMKNGGFPTGDVTFNVRPGEYNQPLVLQNDIYGYDTSNTDVQEHKISFQKLPGSSGIVKINWAGNTYSTSIENENQNMPETNEYTFYTDYAMYFNGFNDISIKDIEIDIDIDSYVYQVGGINFTNGTGINIENCKVSFPTQDPESSYVNTYGIYLWYATDVSISNCEIENGKYGIKCESYDFCERDINISENIFKNQLDYSIYSANWIYYCLTYDNNTVFEDNVFINDLPQTNCVAIYSHNGTTISGNSLSGFKGNGNNPGPSLITVNHSDTSLDDEVIIKDNIIENIVDMSGISVHNVGAGRIQDNSIKIGTGTYDNISKSAINYIGGGTDSKFLWAEKNTIEVNKGNGIELHNTNAKVYNNSIDVISNNPSSNNTGFLAENSSGYIANNRIRGEDINGIMTVNSGADKNTDVGLFFCYNSVAVNSPNNATFKVEGGSNAGTSVLRNMLINSSTGNVIVGTSMGGPVWTSNQNNLKTNGTNIGSWNGTTQTSLANFSAASNGDANSASVEVEFLEDGSLRPKEFTPELVFDTPLFDPDGPLGNIFAECEKFDFFGNERVEFFVGFNNPLITVTVLEQPNDIIDCYGTQGRFFFALATASSGLAPIYQWFKDDEPLEGQTFPGLNLGPLEHDMSGVFKCAITAQGAGQITWTKEATLYVLNAPSITIQPTTVVAAEGDKATLYVDANIYGEQPPSYKVDVQWFRGNTPLVNSNRYEGVSSNYLTINNIQTSDFGDDYWVQLIGNCGVVTSRTVSIQEAPNVNFISNPEDLTVCNDANFEFSVEAEATNNGTIVSYQWYANGNKLEESDYTGVTTNILSGVATENLNNVYVEITVTPGNLKFNSNFASLTLNLEPIIISQPEDTEIQENNDGELLIEVANTFNVTYQWFKEGDNTVLSNEETLVFTNAQESDAGLYYCIVTNDCGEVTSSSASISIKSNSMQLSVEGLKNEFEVSNSPNPAKDETTIFYKVNELAEVRIVISEMTGNELFEMNRGMTAAGYYQFRIDVNKLKLNSGIYFYTLYIGNKAVTNKFVVQK